ncbi:MAG: hypothetical protein MJZ75_06640 [Paludibacteraceae bacterium]|nr:hypothetical protein [Paludibacteraceae bacterium]
MKRYLLFFAVVCTAGLAQAHSMPQRLPEEVANKQTEMICRELQIKDTLQRQQLFSMYLKYAKLRQVSNTREENLQRMIDMTHELSTILSADQYQRFMNHQTNATPRHPHHPYGGMAPLPQKEANKPIPPSHSPQ